MKNVLDGFSFENELSRLPPLAHPTSDTVHGQRVRLENLVQKHKLALSPMRRLPTEILSYIFIFLQQSLAPHDHELYAGSAESLLDVGKGPSCQRGLGGLTKVCKKWRRVILGTSSLWSRFRLHAGAPNPSPSSTIRRYRKTLENCLKRARGQPLEFSFVTSGEGELEDAFRSTLLSYARQWKRVWWESDTRDFWSIMKELPFLEELIVAAPSWLEAHNTPFLSKSNAPSLKRIQFLVSGGSDIPAPSLQLPWSQLTDYRNFHADHELLSVLKSGSSLKVLHYYAHRSGRLDISQTSTIRHVQLQDFTFIIGTPNLPEVLRYIQLPSLRVLRIGGARSRTQFPNYLPELFPFLHASLCTLTTLHLTYTHGSNELMELLVNPVISSNLTELGMSLVEFDMDFSWRFLELLRIIPSDHSQTDDHRPFKTRLPRLQALLVKVIHERHFRLLPFAHLLEAVYSRIDPLAPVASIRAFEFRTGDDWGDIDIQIHGLQRFSYLWAKTLLKVDINVVRIGSFDSSWDLFR
ncbi:hypothetical protein VKT23_015570 [Stygiomarasmius scandens]|uniref:F-box domain-containing protein n=1 Tax=Marasmiellus scandens TaxID=2682957 RepID=A0ABR1IXK4_9AGAR